MSDFRWPWEGERLDPLGEMLRRLRHIAQHLHELDEKLEGLMTAQDDLDQAVAAIGIDVTGLTESGARIEAELVRLEAGGVDTSGLRAALGSLDTAVGDIAAIVPVTPPPPPPPVLAPQPVYLVDGDVDPTTDGTSQWSPAPFTAVDDGSRPLFYFAGDTAGDATPHGDGADGIWHVYTGTLAAA